MIKIHTSDGKTHKIDLLDESQAKDCLLKMRSRTFQSTITGISVIGNAGSRIKCPCCQKPGSLVCRSCDKEVPIDARTSVGVQYSITKPDGFNGPAFFAVEHIPNDTESGIRGGEKVTCFSGDTRTQMMIHAGQPSARFVLSKVGHQRFNPLLE